MNLYILKKDDKIIYAKCPDCQSDMSYMASPDRVVLRCSGCKLNLVDNNANKHLLELKGNDRIFRKVVQSDGYLCLSDYYPIGIK